MSDKKWMWCPTCDTDVECNVEEAVDWLRPEDECLVIECPHCKHQWDYDEYMSEQYEE